jgi:hypothetical protein
MPTPSIRGLRRDADSRTYSEDRGAVVACVNRELGDYDQLILKNIEQAFAVSDMSNKTARRKVVGKRPTPLGLRGGECDLVRVDHPPDIAAVYARNSSTDPR